MDYMENGNIKNSVNYPACDMGVCDSAARIAINHKNIPNMITQFTKVFADQNINVTNMISKSRGDWAYCMLDLDGVPADTLVEVLKSIDGVVKVRVIK